jgi:murein DD-endopeptidase MepM/ murein hydrolase activator NlpD
MVAALCPRCALVVALHEGRPFVSAHGIELWHVGCWNNKDVHLVDDQPLIVPLEIQVTHPRRSRKLPIAGGVAATAILVGVIALHSSDDPDAGQVADVTTLTEATSLRATSTEFEVVPPEPIAEPRVDAKPHPVPVDDKGKPIDEAFPALRSWIHPITNAAELVPGNPQRQFGAHRGGIERVECGEGHCGIDLDGPRGRALVAVADGILVNVERREKGGDGMSGRFVRIQHDDGTITSYMHMDEIDPGLQPGDHVDGGQYIGTLGSTAVSVAHLHFALEVPRHVGSRDTTFGATRFVDPAPFLVRSTVVDAAERHHPVKPAF